MPLNRPGDLSSAAGDLRLAAGLSKASSKLDYVHLNGVDHVLKEDITKSPAAFNQPLPFSAQLRAALKTFLASNH